MKNRFLQISVAFALIICVIPIAANAKGKYISWKGCETFHVDGCPCLDEVPKKDWVYYDSWQEAMGQEAFDAAEEGISIDIKKPCRVCNPTDNLQLRGYSNTDGVSEETAETISSDGEDKPLSFNVEISKELATVLISGIVSIVVAFISFWANKRKTDSEIAKMKLEIDHADKIRSEDAAREREREISTKYSRMLTAVRQFVELPDFNTKNAAISAINDLLVIEKCDQNDTLKNIKRIVEQASAFDGPDEEELEPILDQVLVKLRK